MTKVYVGDTGTALVLDTGQSLAGASSVTIEARTPTGAVVTLTGAVVESTKIRFISLANTFDRPGEWRLQAKAVLPSGTWLGETVSLTVYSPFA
jgi:hypothetical protein